MEQMQILYAHRFMLQAVCYRLLTAALQYGTCILLVILGGIAGVFIAVAVVLAFFSLLDWLVQFFFVCGCGLYLTRAAFWM